jgi:hypothetical protein
MALNADEHTNLAYSLVATAPSPASSGTTVTVTASEGSRFPDPASVGAYNAVIWPIDEVPTPDNAEVVRITAKSTDTLTITRATESSVARTVIVGDQIAVAVTKKLFTDIEDAIADLETDVAALEVSTQTNEVRNFPSMEGADDAQPMWWSENDANAALTEVDLSGEGITESWERALKVVVATSNSWAYQRYTFADEPRLKLGRTVSVAVAVWSVGSVSARVRLQTSAGSIGVSDDTTAAGWTILTVENVTLTGTTLDLRLEVDIGTAYFVPLGLVVGTKAPVSSLHPRPTRYRWLDTAAEVKVLDGLGDEATWTDVDVTANTSPLACRAHLTAHLDDTGTAADDYKLYARRNGSSQAVADAAMVCRLLLVAATGDALASFSVILDDGQIFEYYFDRVAGTGTLNAGEISIRAYEEWA